MTESCIHKQNSKHHLEEVKTEKWSYNSQVNHKVQMEEKYSSKNKTNKQLDASTPKYYRLSFV